MSCLLVFAAKSYIDYAKCTIRVDFSNARYSVKRIRVSVEALTGF